MRASVDRRRRATGRAERSGYLRAARLPRRHRLQRQLPGQAGDARRGAGPSPAAARIRRIAPSPTRHPRPSSPPWMRRYPPARILPRQLFRQRPHPGRVLRSSRRIRIGPFPGDQAPVPGQQGARGHDRVQPQVPGQQPGHGSEHGPVSPVRPRTPARAFSQLTPAPVEFLTARVHLQRFWSADLSRSYILCRDGRAKPLSASLEVIARLGVESLEIDGSHSPFLSRPAQLAGLLIQATTTRPLRPPSPTCP